MSLLFLFRPSSGVAPTNVVRYVNTGSTAGGDGTTNATSGANRAWATLEEARAALVSAYSSGFVAANVQVDLICSGAADDTTAVTNTWPTSDTARYLHIRVPASDQKVAWDSNVYTLVRAVNFASALAISTHSIRLTGLQIVHAGNLNVGGNNGLLVTPGGGEIILDGLKVAKLNNVGQNALFIQGVGASASTVVVRNCITGFFNLGGSSFGYASGPIFNAMPSNTTVIVYNLTHVSGVNGTGVTVTFVASATNAVARVKNCLLDQITNGVSITNATTSDTATNQHSTGAAASFVSGSDRSLTGADTVAKDLGTDLSAVGAGQWQFNVDANGNARPFNSTWDIGAHEYGSTAPPSAGHRRLIPAYIGS